jgi:HEAT repeat protein
MKKLLIVFILCATAVEAQSLQERMLQAEDARPTTDAGMAPLLEGLKGGGRRTAVRAIGRMERPEMIPLIAPALNDGVGIRAEAANALAQMARTPAAVGEVQKLLLTRAATDASLNTWESWGEIAAGCRMTPQPK